MFADPDDGEARRRPAFGHPSRDGCADFGGHFVGDAPAVENSRGHRIAA